MTTKKKKTETPDKFICQVFYSAGIVCGKINKPAKEIGLGNVTSFAKDSSKIVRDNLTTIVNDLRESAGILSKSFRAGFEANDDRQSSNSEETAEKKKTVVKQSARKPKTKTLEKPPENQKSVNLYKEIGKEIDETASVKGRPFGSPPTRGREPRAGTALDTPAMAGASFAVNPEKETRDPDKGLMEG
jgi:hypothetical protein